MAKRKVVEITCDVCAKQTSFEEGTGFPYSEGWHYLHKMSMQIPVPEMFVGRLPYHRIEENDCHFCSSQCMLKFLANPLVNAAEEAKKLAEEEDDNHRPEP